LEHLTKAVGPALLAAFAEDLAAPDRFLANILDALPDRLLLFDNGRHLVFANSAAKRTFARIGMPPGDSLEKLRAALTILDPETQEPVPTEDLPVSRALRGEIVDRTECQIRPARQGAVYWIECSAQPVRSSDGEIRGAVLIMRDVTEQKKRDLAAEAANQLRDFIYHGNMAGIIHTTVDGRIIDCNEAMVRLLGYSSREELKTVRSPQLYFYAGEREPLIRRLREAGQLEEYEICLKARDGSRRWVISNIRLLDPEAGRVGGTIVCVVIDITERKLWEETLRQSQQRFATFMRNLPGVAFVKDLSGKYVYYNESSWALFRKRPEEIVGKTDDELWPPEDAALYRKNDLTVVETARPLEVTETVTHEDGVHSWLIGKFPIMEDGNVALIGGIGIDITERQTLQDQLTQARKMEALGRLAGGVAHDFNNLLTVISGYGQLALEANGNAPPARLATYIQEILTSAQRASGLTGQLLAFSRRQIVQPKILDLRDLVHGMEHLLQRMIGEHVNLAVKLGHDPCPIRADAHQIEQVLMNLAINARDAMPLGGALTIECRVLPEPVDGPAGKPLRVLIEVADNGIGMDEMTKARMFEPFFTSKDKGKGTGLGLSTVYGIVSQSDGRIEVESQPGEGTRFSIFFPLAEGEVAEVPAAGLDRAPVGLETVLLVEDEDSLRALAETILVRLGYRVLVADCGERALEIWKEHGGAVDILLTDVIMPRLGGSELAHKLRGIDPGLKVLFMSGYTDDMIASHGILAGETQLIQKPFTAEALGRKLRSVLDARS
jgi:PAS domain S-box-containing protein